LYYTLQSRAPEDMSKGRGTCSLEKEKNKYCILCFDQTLY